MRPRLGDTFVNRNKGRFAGRLNEKRHFEDSVKKTVSLGKSLSSDHSEDYDYCHIFLVVGLGGMGKTALSKQFIDIAQLNHMVPIYLDAGDELISDEDGLMRALYDKFVKEVSDAKASLQVYRDAIEKRIKTRRKVEDERIAERNAEYQGLVNIAASGIGSLTGPLAPLTTELIKHGAPKAARTAAGFYDNVTDFATNLLKRGKLDEDEHKLFTNRFAIAEKFFDGLHEFASRTPVVIVIDTYEKLESTRYIDEWLRSTVYSLGSPYVLWVIAGRENEQFLERHMSVGSRQIEAIRLRELPLIDIASYLKLRDIYQDDDNKRNSLATTLQSISRGVPLAIEALADMHDQGVDIAAYFDDVLNHQVAHAKMVQLLTNRFLSWCDEKSAPTDEERSLRSRHRFWIEALAMLGRYDRQALRHLSSLVDSDSNADPDNLLNELGARYSFIFNYETNEMHDLVREVIRENWHRRNTPITDRLHRFIVAASEYYEQRKGSIETRLNQNPGKYVSDKEWQEVIVGLLNARFWISGQGIQGMETFLRIAIEVHFFEQEFLTQCLNVIREFKEFIDSTHPYFTLCEIWFRVAGNEEKSGEMSKDVISLWNNLHKHIQSLNLTPDSHIIVLIMRARIQLQEKQVSNALETIDGATRLQESKSNKLRRTMARTFAQAALDLSEAESDEKLQKATEIIGKAIALMPDDWYCHYTNGVLQNEYDNSNEAFLAFQKALELAPENPLVQHAIGNCYRDQDNIDAAISTFEKIIEQSPKFLIGYLALGNVYASRGDYDQAIESFHRGIEDCSEVALIYFELGNVLYRINQSERALEAYGNAIKADSDFLPAYIRIGDIQLHRKQFEDARISYELASKVDENSETPHLALGRLYLSREMSKEALREFELVTEKITPDSYDAIIWQGRVYRSLKEYKLALNKFTLAQKMNPDYVQAGLEIADIHSAKEQYTLAIKLLKNMHTEHPKSDQVLQKLAFTYHVNDEIDAAIETILRAIDIQPEDLDLRITLARFYSEKGNHMMAYSIYKEVIELDPFKTYARIRLADTTLKLGKYTETLEILEHLFNVLNGEIDEDVYEATADYYVAIKDYESALEYFEKVLSLNPKADIQVSLGLLHSYKGNYELAKQYYGQYAKTDPDNYANNYNLVVLEARLGKKRASKDIHSLKKTLKEFTSKSTPGVQARGYYGLGGLALLEGNVQQALEHLDKAIMINLDVRYFALNDIAWNPIRENPRFKKLISYD
jgi:tetratricopeptide (TPR) repeat protein